MVPPPKNHGLSVFSHSPYIPDPPIPRRKHSKAPQLAAMVKGVGLALAAPLVAFLASRLQRRANIPEHLLHHVAFQEGQQSLPRSERLAVIAGIRRDGSGFTWRSSEAR